MNQNILYNALGMNVRKFLHEHSFPTIDLTIFSSTHCTEIRSHLYAMPKNDVKLKEKMIDLLHQGVIEEVRDKEGSYIFLIHIKYKSEFYLVELKLENYEWGFISIHFIGEASKNGKKWIAGAFVLSVLIISIVLARPLYTADGTIQDTSQPGDNRHIDNSTEEANRSEDEAHLGGEEYTLSIEQLQLHAESYNYTLITSEELAQMQLRIENLEKELAMEKDTHVSEDKPSTGGQPPTEVVISIIPGMQSSDIAILLVDNGLARNEAEITQLFSELDVHKKIRAGSFTIPSDATYLEIIRLITKR